MSTPRLLLCTDMDRTVVPNGAAPEDPRARPRLAALCARPEVQLAYVTGRHAALTQEAIRDYDRPAPDWAITDVGSKLYRCETRPWMDCTDWSAEIGRDWRGQSHAEVVRLLAGLPDLELQPPERQGEFKVSFFTSPDANADALRAAVHARLQPSGVEASLVWSVDEAAGMGLFDVLPRRATKRHAVEFLQRKLGLDDRSVVFAGDSGNDLPVLESAVQSVLVANASDEIKRTAQARAEQLGHADRLYIACGAGLGMNGNYAAGVLEGVWHFAPAFQPALSTTEDQK